MAFAVFLPIVFFLYWIIPHRYRWIVLLLSSCYFYMSWDPKYIVLIMFTTFVSYVSALALERHRDKKKRMLLLTLGSSLGVLFFFKYFNFAVGSIASLFRFFSIPVHPPILKIMLPVGISFYTFQTLGYVIDVYRGDVQAERHFGKYAAFITFFPQLVAGPIERTKNLLPQICGEHRFQYGQAVYGARLMAWGYFKKLVIADNLAVYVDRIYNDVYSYRGLSLLVASVFFAFQIYCDFSGYSDIAIGVAKLFGIDLMTNFKSPYLSASIKEFWSRWHISLSTWFRDYVYIPLGGNRRGRRKTQRNLLITFLASGLWHGADQTFVVWGGAHGILQIAENGLYRGRRPEREHGWRRFVSVAIVFLCVCICWVFFRAETVQDAFYVLGHLFDGIQDLRGYLQAGYHDLLLGWGRVCMISVALAVLWAYDAFSLKRDVILWIDRLPGMMRWCLYYLLIIFILAFGNFGSTQFVYFQF